MGIIMRTRSQARLSLSPHPHVLCVRDSRRNITDLVTFCRVCTCCDVVPANQPVKKVRAIRVLFSKRAMVVLIEIRF